jgi:hypothetical protein
VVSCRRSELWFVVGDIVIAARPWPVGRRLAWLLARAEGGDRGWDLRPVGDVGVVPRQPVAAAVERILGFRAGLDRRRSYYRSPLWTNHRDAGMIRCSGQCEWRDPLTGTRCANGACEIHHLATGYRPSRRRTRRQRDSAQDLSVVTPSSYGRACCAAAIGADLIGGRFFYVRFVVNPSRYGVMPYYCVSRMLSYRDRIDMALCHIFYITCVRAASTS